MELLSIFVQNIFPIFIVAGVGFLLIRYLKADLRTVSRMSFYALSPCLVFDMLVTSKIGPDEFGLMALFAVGTVLGIGVIAWLVTRALRLDRVMSCAFLVVVMFANGGNYGLPLTLFAFGQEAITHATIYFVISVLLTFTLGIFLASSGRGSAGEALLGVLKVPSLYAVLTAVALMAAGIVPPDAVMRPIKLLSNAAIPVMLLVLGMQLSSVVKPERLGLVMLAVALRLVASTILGIFMAQLFGLSGAAWQAGIIQTAMPVAVVTTILAVEFEIEPAFVTSTVFLSTVLSPLTLTPLIAFLK